MFKRITYSEDCKPNEIIPRFPIYTALVSFRDMTLQEQKTLTDALTRLARYEDSGLSPYLWRKNYEKTTLARKVVWSADRDAVRCPECGNDLMGGLPEELCAYDPGEDDVNNCWHCGQLLNWDATAEYF